METIVLTHPHHLTDYSPIVLALGFFDGVHLGHQTVLQCAKEEAEKRQLPLAVLTFFEHPKLVYQNVPRDTFQYLTTLERKKELLQSLGVDILYLVEFTQQFGQQTPQEFVDNYIVGLNAQVVVAGYDYTYGKPNIANMSTLPQHAKGRFEVMEVPQLQNIQTKVGSTAIRHCITSCQMDMANQQLGYIYQNSGVVIHGAKRGRTIGYPTANIKIAPQELLPSVGVYIVELCVHGKWYPGMASIGYNVTFESNHPLSCEVYILDFSEMIYGEEVKVRWYHYLRGEIKFESVDALIAQLQQDEADTRKFFLERKGT